MRLLGVVFALVLALAFAGSAQADARAGRQIAEKVCVACHGVDGAKASTPDQPILAGQYRDYLERALLDYKTGARQNPIMKGFVAPLSKKDIADLAEWFSAQKSPLHTER